MGKLRIRYRNAAGLSLGFSIERLADGLFYDFDDDTFKSTPTTPTADLTAGTDYLLGEYAETLDPLDTGQFTDGDYKIGIHDRNVSNLEIDLVRATIFNGDDTTQPPNSVTLSPSDLTTIVDAVVAALASTPLPIDLTASVSETTARTIEGCLYAGFANARHKAVEDRSATPPTLTLYKSNGSTPLQAFTLDDPLNPSTRTPV